MRSPVLTNASVPYMNVHRMSVLCQGPGHGGILYSTPTSRSLANNTCSATLCLGSFAKSRETSTRSRETCRDDGDLQKFYFWYLSVAFPKA
jgi:hypothetical protein